jgi:hypothetical protein
LLDLLEEHRSGAERIRALDAGLAAAEGAWVAPLAIAGLKDFEDIEVGGSIWLGTRAAGKGLPLARQHLLPSDWEVIDAAFTGSVPSLGPETPENFQKLFTLIVNLAPPPIGVGPA